MNPTMFVAVPVNSAELTPDSEIVRYDNFVRRLFKGQTESEEAKHIAIGLCGEAGELADAIKKEYIYGRPRDIENIIEELGDIEWYLQAAYNHYNLRRYDVIQANAQKLAKRYVGLVYSDKAAQDRADKEI